MFFQLSQLVQFTERLSTAISADEPPPTALGVIQETVETVDQVGPWILTFGLWILTLDPYPPPLLISVFGRESLITTGLLIVLIVYSVFVVVVP